jgi:hypothetical protein
MRAGLRIREEPVLTPDHKWTDESARGGSKL